MLHNCTFQNLIVCTFSAEYIATCWKRAQMIEVSKLSYLLLPNLLSFLSQWKTLILEFHVEVLNFRSSNGNAWIISTYMVEKYIRIVVSSIESLSLLKFTYARNCNKDKFCRHSWQNITPMFSILSNSEISNFTHISTCGYL